MLYIMSKLIKLISKSGCDCFLNINAGVACSASADELEEFERRTIELTSLATLSGVPQVHRLISMAFRTLCCMPHVSACVSCQLCMPLLCIQ